MAKDETILGSVQQLPQPPAKKAEDYLRAYTGWVYAAVNKRSDSIAQVQLKLFKRVMKNKEWTVEEVYEHPVLSLLYKVNPFTTHFDLRKVTQSYKDLAGEAAWVLIRNGDSETSEIVEIWVLRPDWIEIVPSSGFIDKYIYRPNGGIKTVEIEPYNLIWFKDFDPTNPYRGYGSVRPAAHEIDIDIFSSQFNRNFFFNSAMPSGLISTEKSMSKESQRQFMEEFYRGHGGYQNAHKLGLLSGSKMEFTKITDSIKEMDFLETKKQVRDKVLSMFAMSKADIGIYEDVNRASADASERRFAKDIIKPQMISFTGVLNEFLLPNYNEPGLFFNFEDPVPEDMDAKLKVYESGLKNGWLLINEVREEEGREPVDGGDSVYLPFSVQPIGESTDGENDNKNFKRLKLKGEIKKKERVYIMPIPPKRLKELKDEDLKKNIKRDIVALILKQMEIRDGDAPKTKQIYQTSTKEAIWKEMVAASEIQEEKMITIMTGLWNEQMHIVLDKLNEASKSIESSKSYRQKVAPSRFTFPLGSENDKWRESLKPLLFGVVRDKVRNDTLTYFGIKDEDLALKLANEYLENEGLQFVNGVNQTTRKAINKSLKEGLAKGEDIDQLKDRITSIFKGIPESRGRTIARTEILSATNFSAEQSYKESGIVEGKQWLTALDERTDKHPRGCGWLDGQTVGVNDDFKGSDFGSISRPPLHPNCRCTIVPVVNFSKSVKKKRTGSKLDLNKIQEEVELKIRRIELDKQAEEIEKSSQKIEAAQMDIAERKHRLLSSMKKKRDKQEAQINEERESIEQTKKEMETEASKIKRDARQEAEGIVAEAQKEKELIVNDLKKLRSNVRKQLRKK